jgi:DNA-directed RNA polymerase specialized sigma24 family protein
MASQRPLLERAAAGDREAFALVYDNQVEGVYRYLLAWTGDRIEAAELTRQVFHSAIGWLPTTTGAEGEAAAWLIAMSRDALSSRQDPTAPGTADPAAPANDVVAAAGRLPEPEREVVVLRLLLGHSLDHAAHLSGYSRRAVLELQLAACLAIHALTAAGPSSTPTAHTAEEFERRLTRPEIDLTGTNPALGVAASLRQAIPGYVVAPTLEFVAHLRTELVTSTPTTTTGVAGVGPAGVGPAGVGAGGPGAVDSRGHPAPRWATLPHRGPQQPEGAGSRAPTLSERLEAAASDPFPMVEPPPGGAGSAPVPAAEPPGGANPPATPPASGRAGGSRRGNRVGDWLARRPWVATGVATAGIVVVLALQAFGGQGGARECGGRPCPVSTTVAVAVGEGDGSRIGTPLTTVEQPTTTSSTAGAAPGGAPPTAAPRTSAVTVPPTTRPATTAVPTTSASRPTTTTRATTTTAPPTTLPTTTTAAPAPT